MTPKRFESDGWTLFDNQTNEYMGMIGASNLLNALHEENEQLKSKNRGLQSELQIFKEDVEHSNLQINKLADENEQLKQSVNNLKDTIIKITIAYQRKYDRTIVDLVDEVHEEDITDLIKELGE